MSTPAAPAPAAPVPTGAPESPAPAPEAPAPTGGAPEGIGTPSQPQPEVITSGQAHGTPPPGESQPQPETPATPPATDDNPAPTSPPAGGEGEPTEVEQLPSWAQKHIRELREENKRQRLETKQAAVEEATRAAREAFAADIGKALGIIPAEADAEAEPLTAEQLTDMLATERASTQTARVELAVFKAAGAHHADPSALLDSRSFLDTLKDIDPTDTQAVEAAIKTAVDANPRLKLAESAPAAEPQPEPTPPPSGGTFAGGPSGRGNDVSNMSIEDFRKQYRDARRSG